MNDKLSITDTWSKLTWSTLMKIVLVSLIVEPEFRTASAKIAQGCVFSQLILSCPEMHTIEVSSVLIGDSSCYGGTNCCIGDNDCTATPNDAHVQYVGRSCDGLQSCRVVSIQQKMYCSGWYRNINNDFERIAYICIQRIVSTFPTTTAIGIHTLSIRNSTTDETASIPSITTTIDIYTSPTQHSTSGEWHSGSDRDAENISIYAEHTDSHQHLEFQNQDYLPSIAAIVCVSTLVILITLVVLILRRKIWSKLKPVHSTEVSHSGDDTHNETTRTNKTQGAWHNLDSTSSSRVRHDENQRQIQTITEKNLPCNQEPLVYAEANCADGLCYKLAGPLEENFYSDLKFQEGVNLYYDTEAKEPAYQIPKPMKPDMLSVSYAAKDSTTLTTDGAYENACCNVRGFGPTREMPGHEIYLEPQDFDRNLFKDTQPAAELQNKIHVGLAKPVSGSAASTSAKPASVLYTQVNKPLKSHENWTKTVVGQGDGAKKTDKSPNTTYEQMTPLQNIYANEAPVGIGFRSETENPYCDMNSPKPRRIMTVRK